MLGRSFQRARRTCLLREMAGGIADVRGSEDTWLFGQRVEISASGEGAALWYFWIAAVRLNAHETSLLHH